jgi:hypothetical protein
MGVHTPPQLREAVGQRQHGGILPKFRLQDSVNDRRRPND